MTPVTLTDAEKYTAAYMWALENLVNNREEWVAKFEEGNAVFRFKDSAVATMFALKWS